MKTPSNHLDNGTFLAHHFNDDPLQIPIPESFVRRLATGSRGIFPELGKYITMFVFCRLIEARTEATLEHQNNLRQEGCQLWLMGVFLLGNRPYERVSGRICVTEFGGGKRVYLYIFGCFVVDGMQRRLGMFIVGEI